MLMGREAWAFLAAWVLAVDADLVRAEGRVAAVAGAAHAHTDRLGDSGELQIGGRLPLFGLEGEPVFGEESACLLLLDDAVVGQHSRLFNNGLWGRGYGRRTKPIFTLAFGARRKVHNECRLFSVRCGAGLAGDLRGGGHRLTFGARTRAQNGLHALQIFGQAFGLVLGRAAGGVLRRHVEYWWISDDFTVAQECNGECSVADRTWEVHDHFIPYKSKSRKPNVARPSPDPARWETRREGSN